MLDIELVHLLVFEIDCESKTVDTLSHLELAEWVLCAVTSESLELRLDFLRIFVAFVQVLNKCDQLSVTENNDGGKR